MAALGPQELQSEFRALQELARASYSSHGSAAADDACAADQEAKSTVNTEMEHYLLQQVLSCDACESEFIHMPGCSIARIDGWTAEAHTFTVGIKTQSDAEGFSTSCRGRTSTLRLAALASMTRRVSWLDAVLVDRTRMRQRA